MATERWFNKKNGVGTYASMMLPIVLFLVQSLHMSYRNFTLPVFQKPTATSRESGNNRFTTNFFTSPENYYQFRTVLSLLGDINNILKRTSNENFYGLDSEIKTLYSEIQKYKDLRDFFTHLDNVFDKNKSWGINGEHKTNFGLIYTKETKNCFHLMIYDETIYFTIRNQCKEVYFGKSIFEPIFTIIRNMYNKMLEEIEHSDLPTAEEMLPF